MHVEFKPSWVKLAPVDGVGGIPALKLEFKLTTLTLDPAELEEISESVWRDYARDEFMSLPIVISGRGPFWLSMAVAFQFSAAPAVLVEQPGTGALCVKSRQTKRTPLLPAIGRIYAIELAEGVHAAINSLISIYERDERVKEVKE